MAPVVRFVPKRIAGAKPIVGVEPLSSSWSDAYSPATPYPGSCLKYLYSPSESASEDEARDNPPSKSAGEDEARDNPQEARESAGEDEARESAGEDEDEASESDSDDWGSWRGFHASSP